LNEPPFDWAPLLDRARAAALHAYSPHSRFRVGAAVLAEDGSIYLGCNVESDVFGLTMCAERTALYAATAAGARGFERLAVACLDAPQDVVEGRMPCGACRQVMAELMAPGAEIMIDGVGVRTIEELLPDAFRLKSIR
jgi:cytidine deaminase